MFVIKFSLVASAALLCALCTIAPMFGQLRAESTQSAANTMILRAMATRGGSRLNSAGEERSDTR